MFTIIRDPSDKRAQGYLHIDRECGIAVVLFWEDPGTLSKLLDIAAASGAENVMVIGKVTDRDVMKDLNMFSIDMLRVYGSDIPSVS